MRSWLIIPLVASVAVSGSMAIAEAGTSGQQSTLVFFSNNPDATVGQGLAEQSLAKQYEKEHPNIHIQFQTLAPDPQYQDKIKIYNASHSLPDIIMEWGNPNYLKPLVANHALAPLNPKDFANGRFVKGAFSGFTYDGKIYGVPKNGDFYFIYYNKALFQKYHLPVPRTQAQLLHDAAVFNKNNIVPMAMDGRDAWTSGLWFNVMLERVTGTFTTATNAVNGKGTFDTPATRQAAADMQLWIKDGVFGKGFLNQDYATARNLFGQGRAAMYMMGEWEMGMVSDKSFPASVRNNIDAFPFPTVPGGKGKTTDLMAWFGGGYGVATNSPHKAEAEAFIKWLFETQHWAKFVWQNGITFPAQDYSQYLTGKENGLQQTLTKMFTHPTQVSGLSTQDVLTPDTQQSYYDAIQNLEAFKLTPSQYAKVVQQAVATSIKESK
ncbi:MAG: extracellular solute-binding protein [Alicyclobacillus sp.]|nr:extracellular solute-binding protein [Alicyclobacillus sp.]